jgi:outer membrane biogenesis lipoprotein LolB
MMSALGYPAERFPRFLRVDWSHQDCGMLTLNQSAILSQTSLTFQVQPRAQKLPS